MPKVTWIGDGAHAESVGDGVVRAVTRRTGMRLVLLQQDCELRKAGVSVERS